MALNLGKGKEINLTKSAPSISEFVIGLSWDAEGDLDASAVLLDSNGNRKGIVYYQELSARGVVHSGDATDGEAEGDDETITFKLNELDPSVERVIVTVTSFSNNDPVMFGSTANPLAKLKANGTTLVEAKLDETAAFGTAVEFVEFFKKGSDWQYKNISETVGSSANGLTDIVAKYK